MRAGKKAIEESIENPRSRRHIMPRKGVHPMPTVMFILNILWFIFGGFISGLAWILAGIIMAITIIGLPWARSCFMLARFSFWPFGYDIITRDQLYGEQDIGTGALGTLGNVIWFVLAGWWLAIGHIVAAIGLAVTIIGIPFAWQHVKLAIASLFPVGKTVVTTDKLWGSTPSMHRPMKQIAGA
jgi:uncharacterized membrane protein YccF (DUF307 family)